MRLKKIKREELKPLDEFYWPLYEKPNTEYKATVVTVKEEMQFYYTDSKYASEIGRVQEFKDYFCKDVFLIQKPVKLSSLPIGTRFSFANFAEGKTFIKGKEKQKRGAEAYICWGVNSHESHHFYEDDVYVD